MSSSTSRYQKEVQATFMNWTRQYAHQMGLRIVKVDDSMPFLEALRGNRDVDMIGSDQSLEQMAVLGEGAHGMTVLAKTTKLLKNSKRMRRVKDNQVSQEVVVKSNIEETSDEQYVNALFETFANSCIPSDLPNFARLLSVLVCPPDYEKRKRFCASPAMLDAMSTRDMNHELRRGRLKLFPVFANVPGITLRKMMKRMRKQADADTSRVLALLLIQVFLAIDELNGRIGIYSHNDLHASNVMLVHTDKKVMSYHGSDGVKRRVPTNGYLAVIIDEGMVCMSSRDTGILAMYSKPFCPPQDIFKLIADVWQDMNDETLGTVLTDLFGKSTLKYLDDNDTLNAIRFIATMMRRLPNTKERTKYVNKVMPLRYLDAVESLARHILKTSI